MKENNALETSVISVFHEELKLILPDLIQRMHLLEANPTEEGILNKLTHNLHKLKGEAKIVQLDLLVDFLASFEEFLIKMIHKKASFTPVIIESINSVFNLLKELVVINDYSQWPEHFQKHQELYKNSSDIIKGKTSIEVYPNNLKNCNLGLAEASGLDLSTVESRELSPEPKTNFSGCLGIKEVNDSGENDSEVTVDPALYDLFLIEMQNQTSLLMTHLLDFEQSGKSAETIEALMRAAHSIKGAARILRLDALVHLSHSIEDCFVAVQKNSLNLTPDKIDLLLKSIDLIGQIVKIPQNQLKAWFQSKSETFNQLIEGVKNQIPESLNSPTPIATTDADSSTTILTEIKSKFKENEKQQEPLSRVLRVNAFNLNRLMGLAGESLIESQWLQTFSASLLKTKKMLHALAIDFDNLREQIAKKKNSDLQDTYLSHLQKEINLCSCELTDRMAELDMFNLRHSSLSDRLYREVVETRMRPFADVLYAFPRLVRDIAKELNKKTHLDLSGKSTPVDRDILEMLEIPLNHLIRNAVDHGIETPELRVKSGKSPEGTLKIEAMHRAGMLVIQISDDGRGIDIAKLKRFVIEKNISKPEIVNRLSDEEMIEFIFLPGFTTKETISEISGRGIGMNVVSSMIHEVGGSVRVQTTLGKGTQFQLTLPLTLSVLRALIVEIHNEPYAFPLAKIERALKVNKKDLLTIENNHYFKYEEKNVGLVYASQIFELPNSTKMTEEFSVVVLSDLINTYGIIVNDFLGEKELVVHELDSILGKTQNLSSGAFLDDGSPILIVDIEDMVRSIDNIIGNSRLYKCKPSNEKSGEKKRILVVEDSITVREVECRLLQNEGYEVQTAINGVDGLNELHKGHYDLLLTDIDMPRMNGIELIRTIRNDPQLKNLPVMIVSYKEREEDRLLGLDAGANYYLSKSSFHDDTLKNAVAKLLRDPE